MERRPGVQVDFVGLYEDEVMGTKAKFWRSEVGELWLARLQSLSEDTIETITARVPASAISELGRAFAREVLRLGRQMLLDGPAPTEPG